MEYQRVKARGQFDHSVELFIGPRLVPCTGTLQTNAQPGVLGCLVLGRVCPFPPARAQSPASLYLIVKGLKIAPLWSRSRNKLLKPFLGVGARRETNYWVRVKAGFWGIFEKSRSQSRIFSPPEPMKIDRICNTFHRPGLRTTLAMQYRYL